MPATYPAREIDGALISGFVAIDINRAVYPTTLIPRLTGMGYRTDLDLMKARKDPDFLVKDLHETLEGRKQAVEMLWDEIDWDLFIIIVTGTDRLMHYLWNAGGDENHPYHAAFLDYYSAVDRFVGRVVDRFSEDRETGAADRTFFMLSDHGFTGIESEVNLNIWAAGIGLPEVSKRHPQEHHGYRTRIHGVCHGPLAHSHQSKGQISSRLRGAGGLCIDP